MAEVDSTLPTSRRGYLSRDELAQFANITINTVSEADDNISQAEEIIDSFAGAQTKFIKQEYRGLVASVDNDNNQFTLRTEHQNLVDDGYFTFCEVEIIGGTGQGQRRSISNSTRAGVITVRAAWTTELDSTSVYRIYQLGKFPRPQDVYMDDANDTIYKSIPEAIKRAVAAQVEYLIEKGEAFFKGDDTLKTSETIGDYSYTNAQGNVGEARLIAPKAKILLRGFKSRIGRLTV